MLNWTCKLFLFRSFRRCQGGGKSESPLMGTHKFCTYVSKYCGNSGEERKRRVKPIAAASKTTKMPCPVCTKLKERQVRPMACLHRFLASSASTKNTVVKCDCFVYPLGAAFSSAPPEIMMPFLIENTVKRQKAILDQLENPIVFLSIFSTRLEKQADVQQGCWPRL